MTPPSTSEILISGSQNRRMILKRKCKQDEEGKLFMRKIINFQQMVRCKGVLLRKDWKIYKTTGQARDEGVSMKRSSTSKELKRRSSVGN